MILDITYIECQLPLVPLQIELNTTYRPKFEHLKCSIQFYALNVQTRIAVISDILR